MSKYRARQAISAAVYSNRSNENPLLSAMPEMLSETEFAASIEGTPPLPPELSQMTIAERRQKLSILSSVFVPMPYMYSVYDQLCRAITTTYTSKSMVDSIRQRNALFCGAETASYNTQAVTGSILGVPGVGKSSTVQRCLETMPQVIEHTAYNGQPFFCKQVLWLRVECPSDCSVKTLAFNMIAALDQAIGSEYLTRLTIMRSIATSALATQVKILCLTHHVGLLIVDEIQNAVETAKRNRQVKPLLKFLVELTNDTSSAAFFVGTPAAEQLFTSQEHLKRRTRGLRLLPFKADGSYRLFLKQLWPYQLTPKTAPLSDAMANRLYDYSGGIPAYIVKIFQEAQAWALLQGLSCINEQAIRQSVDTLAIKVPKSFAAGTYISDFTITQVTESANEKQEGLQDASANTVPRCYANKRGRPLSDRDEKDLAAAYKNGMNMRSYLQKMDLLEVYQQGVICNMLTFFPAPLPDEWWYSVLCRYHVWSGYQKFSATLYELYGTRPLSHGRLFPGGDCYAVMKQIPDGILCLEKILLKHTLMPYYLRFYPSEKKHSIFSSLMAGGSSGLTSIQLQTPEGKQGLKFCPLCYSEDQKSYGEPYWHREHQIPLIPVCPKHGCQLRLVEIPLSRLSELFLPLSTIPNDDTFQMMNDCVWARPLAETLLSILTMPFENGPPLRYSNLENALRSAGFATYAIREKNSIDTEKVRQSCMEFYGKSISEQYFSKLSPAVLYRLCHWKMTSPERFALLTVLAGLSMEELFGPEIQSADPLLEKLLEYQNKGTVYKKEELAKRMGINTHQLDSLVKKYHITPFWKQCSGDRTEHIRIALTAHEKQYITSAAAIHGNGQLAVFARAILLQEAERILKQDNNQEELQHES